jgi:hypothetical protein
MSSRKPIPKSPLDKPIVQKKLKEAMCNIGQGLKDFMSVAESEIAHTKAFNSTGMTQILEQFSSIINTVEHYREYLVEQTEQLAEGERIDILPLLKTSESISLTEYMEDEYVTSFELRTHYAIRSVFDPSQTNCPYEGERELIQIPPKPAKMESEDLSELFDESNQ